MKVIVVGGGIGGLAAAVGLQRIGCEVEVYERAAKFSDVGAGLSVWSNGIYALNQLGVDVQGIRTAGNTLTFGNITKHDGTFLKRVNWDRSTRATGFAPIAIHRPRLLDALLAPIQPLVRTNADCCRVELRKNDVRVEFQDGREAQGDLLVVADGIGSAVRELMYSTIKPKYAGYVAFRGVVDGSVHESDADSCHLSVGCGAQFGSVPLGHGKTYWFGTKNIDTCADRHDVHSEALRHFRHWHKSVPELIDCTPSDAIIRSPVLTLPRLKAWGRGRMTLLGDAAHAMSPNLGQGACQALEDAVVLAACVQKNLAREAPIAESLRAFEKMRRRHVTRVQRDSNLAGRWMQSESRIAGAMFNSFARFIAGGRLDLATRYSRHRCQLPVMDRPANPSARQRSTRYWRNAVGRPSGSSTRGRSY